MTVRNRCYSYGVAAVCEFRQHYRQGLCMGEDTRYSAEDVPEPAGVYLAKKIRSIKNLSTLWGNEADGGDESAGSKPRVCACGTQFDLNNVGDHRCRAK